MGGAAPILQRDPQKVAKISWKLITAGAAAIAGIAGLAANINTILDTFMPSVGWSIGAYHYC
jgi:hypothetical protein